MTTYLITIIRVALITVQQVCLRRSRYGIANLANVGSCFRHVSRENLFVEFIVCTNPTNIEEMKKRKGLDIAMISSVSYSLFRHGFKKREGARLEQKLERY